MSKPFEKKSERIEIRLPYSKKKEFIAACELQGDSPSNAIRRFISSYNRRTDADTIQSMIRALVRFLTRPVPLIVIGTLFAGVVALFIPLSFSKLSHSYFSTYDSNRDGILEQTELGISNEQMEVLLLALDNDGSATITINEFINSGEIAISQYNPGDLNFVEDGAIEGQIKSTRLIKFDFRNPDNVEVSIWTPDMKAPSFHADIIKFVELKE